MAQQFGDSVFNKSTPFNKALDTSPIGTGYHTVFGERGDLEFDTDDGKYVLQDGTG